MMQQAQTAPALRTIRILLEYDGSPFLGWQLQPQGPTVQEVLETAITKVTGERVRVKGSGRTDAGVHALGQVASFRTGARMEADAFRRAFNAVLPPSVAVLAARDAPVDFDAQFSAIGKTYLYRVINRRDPSPLDAGRSWHINRPLNVDSMRRASSYALGKKDFSSFRGAGCAASSPVRTLRRFDIASKGCFLNFELEADGFLRHMVRNLVGTIVEVGLGRFSSEDFADILEARDRTHAGITAPPQGLFLVRVFYPPEVDGW